jgi:hypothetical protein
MGQIKKLNSAVFNKLTTTQSRNNSSTTVESQSTGEISEWAKSGFEDFIAKSEMDAPFTEIANRDKVLSGLESALGVERVVINSITQSDTESGPNGESVWTPDNKDSRVRFVGTWESVSNVNSTFVRSTTVGDFLEVTFYGTGINLVTLIDGSARDFRVSVDGGAEGSNIYPSSPSSVLNGRSYKMNCVVEATSGLSLDWHTVKIRFAATADISIFGVEIVNSGTQISVTSGSSFSGTVKESLADNIMVNYKPAAMGSNGGRVVKYLQGGIIQEAFTEVGTAQYLGSTDHSAEEIARKINFREFGANRSDDFSTLSSVSDRAFTLDDGTTTLVGEDVRVIEGLFPSAVNDFYTLTFVGTGLDLEAIQTSIGADDMNITIDGDSVGTLSSAGAAGTFVRKICSGLPYGTHTVRFRRDVVAAGQIEALNFVIYQPKKPEVEGFVVADYNVVADFVREDNPNPGSTISDFYISQGVVRTACSREFTYSGTWGLSPFSQFDTGFEAFTSTNGGYIEYSFFGTGIEIRSQAAGTLTTNAQIDIDGNTDFSGLTTDTAGGYSFTPSTGILSQNSSTQYNSSLSISGLSLDWHTFRMTNNTGSFMEISALDVITPIHINDVSLKITQSLLTNKNIGPLVKEEAKPKIGEAKALLAYTPNDNAIEFSENISAVLEVSTGVFLVYFETPFKSENYVMAGSSTGDKRVGFDSAVKKANYIEINVSTGSGSFSDGDILVAFFGELQGE